ncbi:hypothetical protein HELRODRAFT_127971, partial [Helobdella robusta]|uniref:Homeobox domain-containing protein n=1 Tax=Helobdella robusta TaxID=6412 RepID=T1EHK1_HELRO
TDSQQKKTRIFFSEEQKHSLRQAYAADPYPSQATLDELAAGLGVATKTVVNWFHNYRMRAKQQMKTTIIASANGTPQENFERKLS